MKKSTVRVTVAFLIIIVLVVSCFAYLSGKRRDLQTDVAATKVQTVLSRDLQKDYPPTVKEVIKYFTDIQRCFYNEECTEEEVELLGLKARELYDAELLENNELSMNLAQLKAEITTFKADKRQIINVAVASGVSVDTFSEDNSDFARIQCTYTFSENGQSSLTNMVYLLRRDENRRWKIYGWDRAENVNLED